MLRFSLCWTHGPPKHRLCSEFDTALDLQKIREGTYVWGRMALDPRYMYNYMYMHVWEPIMAHLG